MASVGAPEGTVTFLFTDVEESTTLVRQLRDAYGDLLATHHRLLREAFAGCGGHEVDTQGDAFFVAFRRARDAVNGAVAAQRSIVSQEWPGGAVVKVRMGIHTTEPGLAEGAYHGLGVIRGSRICSAGHGGQILLSAATRALVDAAEFAGVSFRDLGWHRLKGLDEPEHVFQLVVAGLTDEFPPIRVSAAAGTVAGREIELAAAAEAAVAGSRESPATIEFRILGPLEVLRDGNLVTLGGQRQRAILALLILHANRVLSRDRLVDELWGDQPPPTAVTSLQVYISRLRKLLPDGTLLTRPPGYLLEVEPNGLDLQRFERLLTAGQQALAEDDAERAAIVLHEALELWRGPALAEFAFERFAQNEIGRLENLRLTAVEERIEADLALGRHANLIGELETLITEHPHRERLRGQLMLALYRSGRQTEALEEYKQARASLAELGLEPGKDLRRLERAILTQDATLTRPRQLLPAAPGLPGPLAVRPASPFVGRERELATLTSLLQRAEAGEGQVALIGGGAGSGKSRLARELAHEAAGRGVLVLYGSCDPIVDAPYEPIVEALQFLVRVSDPEALESCMTGLRAELGRLLPTLGPVPADAGTNVESARRRLHAAVVEFLARVCRARPLLVIVDDAHWADAASLQLFRDLARLAPEARLLLLATHRDRSEDLRPAFVEAQAALARIDGISRLATGGLSDEEVAEFVRRSAVAERASDVSDVAVAVHELTDGTPFLLCELWRALADADALEISAGKLRLKRPLAELASPQAVHDVTRHRLSRLAPATTEVLELAAVAGSQFELRVLDEALGAEMIAASLEEALASGTIEELPGPRLAYRFAHELVRRAVYDRLSAVRRAELHLRVGDALEGVRGDATDRLLTELAHHFAVAAPLAGPERAVRYNLRAAEAALSLFAFGEAQALATTALELAPPEDGDARARAQLLLASAEFQLGHDGAVGHAAAAAATFRALGDLEAAAEAELVAADALGRQGRGDATVAAFERALALARELPPSRAKAVVYVRCAFHLAASQGRFREAVDIGEEGLTLSEQLALVPLQVFALATIGMGHSNLDEAERAEQELRRAIELGRGDVAPEGTIAAYVFLGLEMYAQGRLREAGRLEDEAGAESERSGIVADVALVLPLQATVAYVLGDWARAEALIDRYGKLIEGSEGHQQEWLAAIVQAQIARARGDGVAALAHAERGLANARRVKFWNGVGRGLMTLALLRVDDGRPDEAAALVDELLTLVGEGAPPLWWRCLIGLGWLLHDLGRPDPPPLSPRRAWSDPAQAIYRGDFGTAAELLAATDLASEEAYARLRAAEQLAAEGRCAEAQLDAKQARAFYGPVCATVYLRRADALLSAPT